MSARKTKPLPLFPLLMLGTAAYLIVRRPETGVGAWILRGALVGLALLWLAWWWLTRDIPTDTADAADDIIRTQKALYAEQHEFRTVRPDEIRGLDLAFYDRTEQFFRSQQFKLLADVEDVTATREFPKMRTFLRVMSGDGGATQLAFYHIKMRGFYRLLQTFGVLPKNLKMIDLETEMSDGTFIVTANSQGSDTTGAVPGVARFQHPLDTPPGDLLKMHREQVQQSCRRDPALQPVRVGTIQEMIASQ